MSELVEVSFQLKNGKMLDKSRCVFPGRTSEGDIMDYRGQTFIITSVEASKSPEEMKKATAELVDEEG